jgi:hypothetical protein
MSKRELFESPTVTRLQTIIESIREGKLLFPNFQRDFIWHDEKRRRLLDSLLKGLPIGSLLIWRTNRVLICKENLGPFPLSPLSKEPPYSYVLDGLQRLTTLYTALCGDDLPQEEITKRRWPIYYDLEQDLEEGDETRFKLELRGREPPVTWLPLSVVFNAKTLYAHQKRLIDEGFDVLADRAEHLALDFKDYQLALVPIKTDSLELATQSFQRINSEGTKMGEPHMLRALTYQDEKDKTFDLTERFEDIVAVLPWGDLDHKILVNTLKAVLKLTIYNTDVTKIAEALKEDPEILERLKRSVLAAVEFLVSVCRVEGERALPYAYQFVALAYAAYHGEDLNVSAEPLSEWVWATTYGEYFTNMKDAKLRDSFEHVRKICRGGQSLPSKLNNFGCSPLEQFNAQSVRGLAFMHLLARQELIDEDERPVDGHQLLARGAEVFTQLYPTESGSDPANRILVAPESAASVRRLLDDQASKLGQRLREAHVLPTHSDPTSREVASVLDWRRERLREMELIFIKEIGLVVLE